MKPRQKSLLGLISLAIVGFGIDRVLFPIGDAEVQAYWTATAKPYLAAHASGWIATVVDWLGPFWLGVAATLVALVAFEMILGLLAKRRHPVTPSRSVRITPSRKPIPRDTPIARAAAISEGIVKFLTESPKPKPAPTPLPPDPEPEWDKLYGTSEDGQDIRLLLLPDGEDIEGHTLLLVLYGHKIKFGRDRVLMSIATTETLRALRKAPNASFAARTLPFLLTTRSFEPEAVGKGAFDRAEVQRVGLSKGVQLEVTWSGIDRANDLARDLIRRA